MVTSPSLVKARVTHFTVEVLLTSPLIDINLASMNASSHGPVYAFLKNLVGTKLERKQNIFVLLVFLNF